MDKASRDPLWAVFKDGGYILETEEEGQVADVDEPLIGVLTDVQEDVGENESRLYTVRLEDEDRPVKFWGKSHIDRQVDDAGIGAGDEIGVLKTGEEIDTGQESPMQEYEVRTA
jgi:hypothetical protein